MLDVRTLASFASGSKHGRIRIYTRFARSRRQDFPAEVRFVHNELDFFMIQSRKPTSVADTCLLYFLPQGSMSLNDSKRPTRPWVQAETQNVLTLIGEKKTDPR